MGIAKKGKMKRETFCTAADDQGVRTNSIRKHIDN